MIKKNRFGLLQKQIRRFVAIALMAFVVGGAASAQNLVPNPSFELKTSCPSGPHR